VIGSLNDGEAAYVRCQTVGGMISGGEGSNDVWDQIDYAGGIGYVADLYLDTPGGDTPHSNRHFTSSIARCASLPAPTPPPPPAPPAPPAQHVFPVHNTCADHPCGLLVETAPGSGFGGQVIGSLNDGDAANIRCQTVGGMVSGGEGSNDVWDQIDYAGGIGYVADLYMDTPGTDTPQPLSTLHDLNPEVLTG
jgi:hypothetical protein